MFYSFFLYIAASCATLFIHVGTHVRKDFSIVRVNNKYNIFGMGITQAEIISLLLIAVGVFLLWYLSKRNNEVKDKLA